MKHISLRGSEIRFLSPGQIVFLLAMQDVESMRSAAGLPSSLASYFTNDGLNKHSGLSSCMESVAEKVRNSCEVGNLRSKVDNDEGYPWLHKCPKLSSIGPSIA